MTAFLEAVAREAEDGLQLLLTLERAWLTARSAVALKRSNSRAALAIDVLAAAPLVSATSLGQALGMAVKNAARLLEQFQTDGIAIEVTLRWKRRLFGLKALAPLRDEVAPPRRPVPGRGRGRVPVRPAEVDVVEPPPTLPSPSAWIKRRSLDYSGLDAALALADEAMRNLRRVVAGLNSGAEPPAFERPVDESGEPAFDPVEP